MATENNDSNKAPDDSSGRLDDLMESISEQSVPYLSEILKASASLAGDLATAAPHVGNLILAYRQKRAERNLRRLIEELQKRMVGIEERLSNMTPALREEIREKVFPTLLDFVHDEPEEEKVPHYASGFQAVLNLQSQKHPNVLFAQFSELLSQLSYVELLVLADMAARWGRAGARPNLIPGLPEYLEARGLTEISFSLIQQKLHRLNLLADENENKAASQIELLSKVTESLLSRNPQISGHARNISFFSKPNYPQYAVTLTGHRLLTFCEFPQSAVNSSLD